MQQLSMTDKELHLRAQEVRKVKVVPQISLQYFFDLLLTHPYLDVQSYRRRWFSSASRVSEKVSSKARH